MVLSFPRTGAGKYSVIFTTPSSLQTLPIISPISLRYSPNNAFLRYFGIHTRWYVQLYLECAKLLSSMDITSVLLIMALQTNISLARRILLLQASPLASVSLPSSRWGIYNCFINRDHKNDFLETGGLSKALSFKRFLLGL